MSALRSGTRSAVRRNISAYVAASGTIALPPRGADSNRVCQTTDWSYTMGLRQVTLQDRYELDEGTVLATGVQASVRLILDQLRADRRAGLRTAAFVSGYRGS